MEAIRRGRVTAFDEAGGLGVVADGSSGDEFPFHCTAVSDGSRTIPAGADVVFTVAPGLLGRIEAVEVMAIQPAS